MTYFKKNNHATKLILFAFVLFFGAFFVVSSFATQTQAQEQAQLQTIIDNQNNMQTNIAVMQAEIKALSEQMQAEVKALNGRIDTLFWIVGFIALGLVFVITQLFYLKGDVWEIKGALSGVDGIKRKEPTTHKIKKALNTRKPLL